MYLEVSELFSMLFFLSCQLKHKSILLVIVLAFIGAIFIQVFSLLLQASVIIQKFLILFFVFYLLDEEFFEF